MRAWLATLLLASLAASDLATGLRQVREGDFEGAVVTLQAVVAQLGPSGPPRDLSQAHLYLGIAQLALEKREEAKARFLDALRYDPELTLSPAAFSPKVLSLFSEARQERARAQARAPAAKGGRGSKTALIIGGAVAAGAGIVLATRGGDSQPPPPPPGETALNGVRFSIPTVECRNGAEAESLGVTVLADISNSGDSPLIIGNTTVVLMITLSSFPEEIGFQSNREVRLSADRVPARSRTTIALMTDLVCGNGPGDPARSNDWLARVRLETSAGIFNAETADRLRVNIP
jgi:hypothetical protein